MCQHITCYYKFVFKYKWYYGRYGNNYTIVHKSIPIWLYVHCTLYPYCIITKYINLILKSNKNDLTR